MTTDNVNDIVADAIRLENDVNGNPRYYISAMSFVGQNGKMYRPFNAVKYRGKKYAEGWVFQSYNLKRSVEYAIEHQQTS